MLTNLTIKDYALIENIEIEFNNGLNIITGETGAGKSILIGALGLILGDRASTEIVRRGAKKSIVEGIFEVRGNKYVESILTKNDIDIENELIVRREVSLKGLNRCFINDTPVSLSLIKEIGNHLVDLHGQHEHQSLLRTNTHIVLLDQCGNYENLLEKFSQAIVHLNKLQYELRSLKEKEEALSEKLELYRFQIKEINEVSPKLGEDERIEQELNLKENAERLLEITTGIYAELYEDEGAIYERLVKIENELNRLSSFDNKFNERANAFNEALAQLNDTAEFLREYRDSIDLDSENLEELRQRSGSINLLKKKYGGSIKALLEYKDKIESDLDLAENFTEKIENINNEISAARINAGNISAKISQERQKLAAKIKIEIEESLKYLGISDSKFEIRFTHEETENVNHIIVDKKQIKFSQYGCDEIEFYISTNPGEQPKPLTKVASGGEISRIMLSLKSVLAKNDKLPLLIFDEIDTGVSGRIAQKVGNTIKELANHHQILAITHLPQIAGLGDFHYSVEKNQTDSRVITTVRQLTEKDRIEEIAKLLSGEKVTESSLVQAKELITKS